MHLHPECSINPWHPHQKAPKNGRWPPCGTAPRLHGHPHEAPHRLRRGVALGRVLAEHRAAGVDEETHRERDVQDGTGHLGLSGWMFMAWILPHEFKATPVDWWFWMILDDFGRFYLAYLVDWGWFLAYRKNQRGWGTSCQKGASGARSVAYNELG